MRCETDLETLTVKTQVGDDVALRVADTASAVPIFSEPPVGSTRARASERSAASQESGRIAKTQSPSATPLLDIPLKQSAQSIVPIAVTAAEAVNRNRSWASGRCLDAEKGGIYQFKQKAVRRKVKVDPSLN